MFMSYNPLLVNPLHADICSVKIKVSRAKFQITHSRADGI